MPESSILAVTHLQTLFEALQARGHQVIGPILERGAITYAPLSNARDLPGGYVDEQSGGRYRLKKSASGEPRDKALFGYAVGPQSWKRFLFPPRQRLWQARQDDAGGFKISPDAEVPAKYAFFGVRPCELAAIRIQDRVFCGGEYRDASYQSRRKQAFLLAVNCTRAGGTCFCTSMHTGPAAESGFDLCLTELADAGEHRFLIQTGSEAGAEILHVLPARPAGDADIGEARRLSERAAASMGRHMPEDAAEVLARNPEHPRWRAVGQRCLSCANCTLVCPTCFCSTMEDGTSLDGSTAERWRRWDSCFTVEFSHIHDGPIRLQAASRYRQWISHKLSHWHRQFGSSGCTGCGRCITWCPVGIDITEEVAAIRASESQAEEGDT